MIDWLICLLLLLFWHAPLGVRSTIRRHQPPQRTVLSQVDCFIQCEVVGSQISLDGVQPRDTRTPWWSLPVLWWESHYDHLGIWILIDMCGNILALMGVCRWVCSLCTLQLPYCCCCCCCLLPGNKLMDVVIFPWVLWRCWQHKWYQACEKPASVIQYNAITMEYMLITKYCPLAYCIVTTTYHYHYHFTAIIQHMQANLC